MVTTMKRFLYSLTFLFSFLLCSSLQAVLLQETWNFFVFNYADLANQNTLLYKSSWDLFGETALKELEFFANSYNDNETLIAIALEIIGKQSCSQEKSAGWENPYDYIIPTITFHLKDFKDLDEAKNASSRFLALLYYVLNCVEVLNGKYYSPVLCAKQLCSFLEKEEKSEAWYHRVLKIHLWKVLNSLRPHDTLRWVSNPWKLIREESHIKKISIEQPLLQNSSAPLLGGGKRENKKLLPNVKKQLKLYSRKRPKKSWKSDKNLKKVLIVAGIMVGAGAAKHLYDHSSSMLKVGN